MLKHILLSTHTKRKFHLKAFFYSLLLPQSEPYTHTSLPISRINSCTAFEFKNLLLRPIYIFVLIFLISPQPLIGSCCGVNGRTQFCSVNWISIMNSASASAQMFCVSSADEEKEMTFTAVLLHPTSCLLLTRLQRNFL